MQTTLAFASAFALGHCLFLLVFCWQQRHQQPALRWLAGLLLAVAIRLSKSVFLIFVPTAPYLVPASGLVGMMLIGPFLWFYIRSGFGSARLFRKTDYFHFAGSFVIAFWQFFNPSDSIIFYQYAFAALHMAAYTGMAAWIIYRRSAQSSLHSAVIPWLNRLFIGIGCLWLVFFIQLYAPGQVIYLLITLIAALVLYGISFWGLRHARRLTLVLTTRPSVVNEQLQSIGHQINQLMVGEQLYTDSNLTLPKLASRLKLPPHLTSKALNQTFRKTFPELLTEYRLQDVASRLTDPAFANYSMEAIAAECGFNSLSTFYTAFKKMYRTTPADYQKRHQKLRELP
ncbi:helix-turn-helix domain-containing protein [Larkinella sp. VNQ87]|uniref:helix-turn-helix domain-containing protein n=1 Tax=Larkinella sp. VNQ87 TaxID=3400921 RepID=UPI003C10ADB0